MKPVKEAMKSVIFALIAIVLYAIQNTVIDVKLKSNSTVSLLLGFYIILLPIAICHFSYMKLFGGGVVMPTGNSLLILGGVAVAFYVADYFYIGAYTAGGNVASVSIIAVLMPAVGVIMKFFWVKETPTPYHYGGFVFATLAIIFIAIGNSKKEPQIGGAEKASASATALASSAK